MIVDAEDSHIAADGEDGDLIFGLAERGAHERPAVAE
jgi:hypothetical protein